MKAIANDYGVYNFGEMEAIEKEVAQMVEVAYTMVAATTMFGAIVDNGDCVEGGGCRDGEVGGNR